MGRTEVTGTPENRDGFLKAQRLRLGLTQKQVADKAGILLQHYQKFEGGERDLRTASFDVACRVLEALEVDIVKYFHTDERLQMRQEGEDKCDN